jgi:hypothetical protein
MPANKIKGLKPRMGSKSRFKQGYFDVSKSLKYMNSGEPCIYRSSLEFKFMKWCEHTDRVVNWNSEPFSIKYICLETGKERNYYIDFSVITQTPETWIIEVKPHKEVLEAEKFGKIYHKLGEIERKKFVNANKVAAKNYSKWKHAKQICEERSWKFIIVTEKFLNRSK